MNPGTLGPHASRPGRIPGGQPKIVIRGLTKRYYDREAGEVVAFQDVTMEAGAGEFVSLVGPSGCGKTTLLNIIAGLDDPSEGLLEVRGLPGEPAPGPIAYMFQRDLLLPWKSVVENVSLGLQVQGVARQEALRRAWEHLERFGLAGFGRAYPAALSGGMRQRAALLRTVLPAYRHGVLLLDEPLGALDSISRMDMQDWLQEVWETFRPTVLMVTHDIEEALFLSDRVYVMSGRPGRIQGVLQVALPRPRVRSMVTQGHFLALKEKALALLGRGRSRGGTGDGGDG